MNDLVTGKYLYEIVSFGKCFLLNACSLQFFKFSAVWKMVCVFAFVRASSSDSVALAAGGDDELSYCLAYKTNGS